MSSEDISNWLGLGKLLWYWCCVSLEEAHGVALIANWVWMEQIVDLKICVASKAIIFSKTKESIVFIESINSFGQKWHLNTQPSWTVRRPSPSANGGGRIRRCFYQKCRCASLEGGRLPGLWGMGCRNQEGPDFRRERKQRSRSEFMSVRLHFLLLRVHEV